jgi:hypothetical protein
VLCAVAVAVPLVRSTPDPAPAPSAGPVTAGGTGTRSPGAPRSTPVLVGPARGSLAGDSGFLDAVRQVGWGGLEPPAPADREVVFAADTPDGRVALVVGTVLEDFRGVWLTGPVGAAPDQLVPHLPQQLGRDRPVTLLLGGPGPATLVVVAGRQDEITVSERLMTGPRGTVGRAYVPVGTADGIAVVPARTTSAGPALSVRVAREGREVYRAGVDWPGAQPGASVPVPLPAPLRSSAAAPDPHVVDAALIDLAVPLGVEPAALQPQLLWSGALPLGHGEATVAVVVAHSPGGALVVTTWAGGSAGAGTCGTQTPPGTTDVATLTVARICDVRSPGRGSGNDASWLVVTAPPASVSAEVLDGDGRVVGVLALQSGGAVEPLPAGARSVRTLDATGRSVHDIPIAPRPTAPFGDFGTGPEG